MSSQLRVSIGQYSDKGQKDINQDFYGYHVPNAPLLLSKGIAVALADGISSSEVSQIASKAAVSGFLEDYFCTSEAWSVKQSARRVLIATNSWLFSQSQQNHVYRIDKNKGYVCTFSTLILKSATAYLFHVGDSRIYRLRDNNFEQLTDDHRHWTSQDHSYLSRALGITSDIEIDYLTLPVEQGDMFILATDGIYEHVSPEFVMDTINTNFEDLDKAAQLITSHAYEAGSSDNLTIQIVRVDELHNQDANELYQQLTELPFPPILQARMKFDGYTIIREVHASHRSHVYLALNDETKTQVIIKTPSVDLQGDPEYLERFLMEEWIARRINSPYVLKPYRQTHKQNYLYIVMEYIEGQTLTQWMVDNPKPHIETVRGIVEQIAKGLLAFHRLEMLHQDLRPDNIMIDHTGTVKIIDFGSTQVAGLMEIATPLERTTILGTAQYTAPEYFLGETGTTRSDMFSLGVITYQMLVGTLPYGTRVSQARTKAAQRKLIYNSVLRDDREIPAWIDDVLKKMLQPDPYKRYEELSEFMYDLRKPNKAFLNKTAPPLIDRDPVLFWKMVSLILTIIIAVLLTKH